MCYSSNQGLGLTITQETLRDVFAAFFTTETPIDRVRATEASGFDREAWQQLIDMGVLTAASATEPHERALLTDLVLIAEQRGRRLAPVPLIEAIVAARAESELPASSSPGASWSTISLRPPVRSEARFVPWAPVAESLIAWDGSRLLRIPLGGTPPGSQDAANLGAIPLRHVALEDGCAVLAGVPDAQIARSRMLADWHVLTAASLVGLGNEALEITVRYVMERSAFGKPIGSFQTVAHRLADHVVALDGARLLVFEAAGRIDQRAHDAFALAAAAYANAAKVAEDVTVDGLHFHGGMGYTREYDIQMYFRRAKAWPLVLGDPREEYVALGEGLLAGEFGFDGDPAKSLTSDGPRATPEFAYHRAAGSSAVRSKMRTFFDQHYPAALREKRFDRPHSQQFVVELQSWLRRELDGTGALGDAIFMEEADRAGYFYMDHGPSELIAAVLRAAGDAAQRQLADEFASGRLIGCLGFSEPGSGSDIAAARSRATRHGDGWVISGQKAYTTLAEHATHVLLLTRTNDEVAKHRGLTLFLVPMNARGVEVAPIELLVTHATNMTYYDEVRVNDSARVGDVDGGWQVMKVALGVEQAGSRPAYARQLIEAVVKLSTASGERGLRDLATERIGRAFVDQEVGTLLGYRNLWAAHGAGRAEAGWGQGAKLFATEAYDRAARDLIGLLGPDGLVLYETDRAGGGGWPNFAFRDAPVRRIAGGASEVLRDFIAERRLGLPRLRPPA